MRPLKFRVFDSETGYMHYNQPPWVQDSETYKVMQFTGFYDIDEKEVYEGDLVTFPMDESKTIFQAKFDTEIGTWMLDNWCGNSWCGIGENNRLFKIVGNIYKNPELLDGKNDNS